MQRSENLVALVTGASSGIGAAFVKALALRGYRVVLVGRERERLQRNADAAQHFGISHEVMEADLITRAGRDAVCARLEEGVDLLVNAAGLGLSGAFWTVPRADLIGQLDVNVTAMMETTRAALGPMVDAGRGAIINVSSITGLVPGRGATYAASKAWAVFFTEGLAPTLEGTGVQMQVLCPGFVRTEFHARAGIDLTSMSNRWWMEARDVAHRSLVDLDRGRTQSIPGLGYRILYGLLPKLPRHLGQKLNRTIGNSSVRS